jgi:ubiquinone/menaquinone biosynthesis C-methylase UbiE
MQEVTMTLSPFALNTATLPELYERFLVGPLFRPWAEVLVERASLGQGDQVLDVACGTGVVARIARAAVGERGRVVAVDQSAPMLGVARSIEPSIDWREGNASALPIEEHERFDAVFCQQGLQFFPDKLAAACEMRRALAPGGRVAVATWRPLDDIPLFRELHEVAQRHLGPVVDQRHSFGDAAALGTLLMDAGLQDVKVNSMSRLTRMDDAAMLARLNAMAVTGMSPEARAMSDERRAQAVERIIEESLDAMAPYRDGPGVAFEISTNVATACT